MGPALAAAVVWLRWLLHTHAYSIRQVHTASRSSCAKSAAAAGVVIAAVAGSGVCHRSVAGNGSLGVGW
jgi:hypothetical protein